MNSRIPALLIAFVLLLTPALTPATAAPAQTSGPAQPTTTTSAQDWQGLRALKPGIRILVEFKAGIGDPTEGRFVGAIGSKLTLSSDGYQRSLEQRDIQRVYRLRGRRSRGITAGIGAGIGFLVGASIGSARVIRAESEPGHVPSADDTGPLVAGAALGTLAGAGAGALLGGKRRGKLLYESN